MIISVKGGAGGD